MKKRNVASNEKGQFVIEAVLLMIVMLGILIGSVNALRDSKFLAKLVSGPWERVSGMMESGVWKPAKDARQAHPNQTNRSISINPKEL